MIPVNTPLLEGNEKVYLVDCVESGWISSEGPYVRRFESEFSTYVGRKHGVAVSSGSAALDVAIKALGLKEGDEVIVPAFTIISPVQSLVNQGLKPVLVDVDGMTFNMRAEAVAAKVTEKTKAILVVHIYGLPVDFKGVLALAKEHDLRIIEDAAEVHGQSCRGERCGSLGDISIFSFYPNKHITCGEGGMVLTDDVVLAERARELRNLCFQPQQRFVHHELGWNYRMTNMQAALGLAQLEQLDKFVQKKRAIGQRYNDLIDDKFFQKPLVTTEYADNIYWVYTLVLKDEFLVQEEFPARLIMERMGEFKIGTRPFFWGMHEQPVFQKMGLFIDEVYPVTERIARRGFYIPSGLALSPDQQEEVALRLHQVMEELVR